VFLGPFFGVFMAFLVFLGPFLVFSRHFWGFRAIFWCFETFLDFYDFLLCLYMFFLKKNYSCVSKKNGTKTPNMAQISQKWLKNHSKTPKIIQNH
jgi:hypothetical protein